MENNNFVMADQGQYKTKTTPDPNSSLFLKIINEGVNNIILNLKTALDGKNDNVFAVGTTQATNNAAKQVFDALELLKTEINRSGVENETLQQNLITSQRDNGDSNTTIEDNIVDYENKASNHLTNSPRENTISYTSDNVQKRIFSCIYLEALYLKKHDEILKIFSFVLNLFDKYKYAIKVILYLLKNLVRPEDISPRRSSSSNNGSDTPLDIRLPKPLIKNINLLLKDQDNIQKVIKTMEPIIDNNDFMTTEENLDTDPGAIQNDSYPDTATATAT